MLGQKLKVFFGIFALTFSPSLLADEGETYIVEQVEWNRELELCLAASKRKMPNLDFQKNSVYRFEGTKLGFAVEAEILDAESAILTDPPPWMAGIFYLVECAERKFSEASYNFFGNGFHSHYFEESFLSYELMKERFENGYLQNSHDFKTFVIKADNSSYLKIDDSFDRSTFEGESPFECECKAVFQDISWEEKQ